MSIDRERVIEAGGRAVEILQEQAETGDARAAQALADRAIALDRDQVRLDIKGDLDTIDDIVAAARHIITAMLAGEIPISTASAAMAALRSYGEVLGGRQLEELVKRLRALEDQRVEARPRTPSAFLPSWGNLGGPKREGEPP